MNKILVISPTYNEAENIQTFIDSVFLGQEKISTIYYPYPWMRNSDVQIKNIPNSWIQIKNC